MDFQVSIHADQPKQCDTNIHVHVEEVAHYFTQGGTQVPDVALAVIEYPERQTYYQQQVCESYIDEEHTHRVLLRMNTEENPQSHQVPNQTQDEDYSVEHRQWALHSSIIHTCLLGVKGRSQFHLAGHCGGEKKGAVGRLEAGCGRRGGCGFWHDGIYFCDPQTCKWARNKGKIFLD